MKKCDEISAFIRTHLNEISKDDVRMLNMLIFKTDLMMHSELRKILELLPEEDANKLRNFGTRPYAGIQNEMNSFIIKASEANLQLNKIIDEIELDFKIDGISNFQLNNITRDAKQKLNDIYITYYINFEYVDLYFKACDIILEKYK
jgi:hypothetical protein